MARPAEPEVKVDLLRKCLEVALEKRTIGISINEYGKEIGSSGRMLAYHFETKAALDKKIIQMLENELRASVLGFAEGAKSHKNFLLQLWDFLTKDEGLQPMLALMLEVAAKSPRDQSLRSLMDDEMNIWLEVMRKHLGNDKERVLFGFHVLQGALLDFLVSGNAQRGRRSLMRLMDGL